MKVYPPLSPDLVSVIIPVYNSVIYLKETLDAVFSQTYANLQVITIDDGSTDGSVQFLEQYGEKVLLLRQENKGAAAARNSGIRAATGKWIAFCDSDDIWLPTKIEKQIKSISNYGWSYTDSCFLGGVNDGIRDSKLTSKYSGEILEKLLVGNFLGTSCLLVSREILLHEGGFDESLRSIQDWELWVRIASNHAIVYVDQALVRYRIHGTSTSRKTRNTLPNHLKVIDKIFAPKGPGSKKPHLKATAKAQSFGICAQIAEEEGDYLFAWSCACNALLLEPRSISRWKHAIKASIKYPLSLIGVRR